MRSIYPFLLLLSVTCFVSCKKNGGNPGPVEPPSGKSHATDILTFGIVGMDARATVVTGDKMVSIRLPDTLTSGAGIATKFTVSPGATVEVNGTKQVSGNTTNNFENEVDYKVIAEDGVTYTYWRVIATNTDYSIDWGLGHIVKKVVSHNRSYNWYIDQATTGAFASVNCGPSSVTMAIKWYDSTFTKTAEDARNFTNTTAGLWYPATFTNYLTANNVPFTKLNLNDDTKATANLMINEVDKGHILISTLYTSFIRPGGSGDQRVDRYYEFGFGHCIVVKGYAHVDGEYFFQVYDPWDYGAAYTNGAPKGMDRYYRAADVADGVKFSENNVLVIAPK